MDALFVWNFAIILHNVHALTLLCSNTDIDIGKATEARDFSLDQEVKLSVTVISVSDHIWWQFLTVLAVQ